MSWLLIIGGLLGGACIGSFCNVLIIRLHEGRGIGGRSACPHCHRTLQARHLVPVLSWVVLRARCAFCSRPIHWQYPVVESVGALIGLAVAMRIISSPDPAAFAAAGVMGLFFFILLVVTAFDLRWQLVPVEFTLGSAMVMGLAQLTVGGLAWWSVLLGCVVTAVLLGLPVVLSGGRMMGEGDPVVGLLLGAALGWPGGALAVFLAFLIGGCVSMPFLLAGRVGRKTAVPFVPFLALGAVVAYFYQSSVIDYLYYAFS